ncbi:MAG TPA: hypothetical protein VL860_01950, partial [Planctomycetota bacterium]|nr:hypothetical protein [Planctomycetota bacterium]
MTRTQKPSSALPIWKGKVLTVPIPQTRDPFVNTPLLPVGPGKNGAERFWISSWNSLEGTIGVLVDEFGQSRIYRFKNPDYGGFYSAVQEDDDTLWLCGWLDFVVRLRLSTGKTETFPTGAPHALVFAGMAFDRATGKLFAAAFPPPHIAAFSFDIKNKKTVKLHREFTPQHYMRCSFPNGNGTHTVVMQCPGLEFLQWNPADDSLSTKPLAENLDLHHDGPLTYRMIADDRGRRYVPHQGWYDPIAKSFDTGSPKPEKEMPWFARQGTFAYGAEGDHFYEWDLATGKVRSVCVIPHANYLDTQVTASRRLISVNYDGFFARVDAQTGAPECTQKLATDSIGHVDCLVRVDKDRLIGTPFITQRFWEANLKTGKGFDCGKAAPGGGEILEVWNLRNKIYMAAYGGGELVEYDPRYHPNFPENPRIVADAPGGMRPVAKADDGTSLYYSCSANYGNLGSTLTKFNTRTGLASYSQNPLPNQQINSMVYSKKD